MSTQKKDDFDRLFNELGLRRRPARPRTYFRSGTREVTPVELFENDLPSDPKKAERLGLSHGKIVDCVLQTAKEAYEDPDCRVKSIRGRMYTEVPPDRPDSVRDSYFDTIAFLIEIPSVIQQIGDHQVTLSLGGLRAYPGLHQPLQFVRRDGLFQLLIGYNVYVCTNLCYHTEGVQLEVHANTEEELRMEVRKLIQSFNIQKPLAEYRNWQQSRLSSSGIDELFRNLRNRASQEPRKKKSTRGQDGVRIDALNARRLGLPFDLNQVARARHGLRKDPHFRRDTDGSITLWNLYNLFTESLKDAQPDRFLRDHEQVYRFMQGLYIKTEWDRLNEKCQDKARVSPKGKESHTEVKASTT